MRNKEISKELSIPEGVTASFKDGYLTLAGSNGEVKIKMIYPTVSIKVDGNNLIFSTNQGTQREKKLIGTYYAQAENAFKGVVEGHKYTLKICSGHFPMNVSISGQEVIIKNFLGESVPRKVALKDGVKGKIDGGNIVLEGADKRTVSQSAGDIEQICKITNKDRRIFQDGIYIINKDGKEIK